MKRSMRVLILFIISSYVYSSASIYNSADSYKDAQKSNTNEKESMTYVVAQKESENVVKPQENKKNIEIFLANKKINYLSLGDTGSKVIELQNKLNNFKFKLAVDGEYGYRTYAAVKKFQEKVGIESDGVAGPDTFAKLDSTAVQAPYLYASSTTANSSDSKENYENIVNSNNCPSQTGYFIYTSLSNHEVCILTGNNHNWSLKKTFSCSTGKSSTPTVNGHFTLGEKGDDFVTDSGLICKYYSQITGNYLFHSVLYYKNGKIADDRLGLSISHGCIRLEIENALYIFNNIPSGTAIWIQK